MKFALSVLALLLCLSANAAWTASNPSVRPLPSSIPPGELIAAPFPLPNQRLSFITTSIAKTDLRDSTLTATFYIAANNPVYTGVVGGSRPVNFRFFFSANKFVYKNFGKGNPTDYWFCQQPAGFAYVEQVDDGALYTITATISQPVWTHAYGGTDGFMAAASGIRHIGLAFGGGDFFDLGVGVSSGQSTFHLVSFIIQ